MSFNKPREFSDYPDVLADKAPFGPYRAVVLRVVDGDTLYVNVDLGFNLYQVMSVRLKDVDAPEMFSGDNREAGIAARDYVMEVAPSGTHCLIYSEKWSQSFTRYVASILLEDGEYLGEKLVKAGHATYV